MYKDCKECSQSFKIKPSQYNRRKCCSKECQKKDYRKSMIGINNPNFKGGFREYCCIICQNKFKVVKVYRDVKTCSKNCYLKFVSQLHKGKSISLLTIKKGNITRAKTILSKGGMTSATHGFCNCGNKKEKESSSCKKCFIEKIRTKRKCIICQKNMRGKNTNAKTCSKECSSNHKSNLYRGKGNPRWKGGVKPEHQRIRGTSQYKNWIKYVFNRDAFTCCDCGRIGGQLHAHHIKEFAKYPELRLDINNGKTLCLNCHAKYHPFLNPVYKKRSKI